MTNKLFLKAHNAEIVHCINPIRTITRHWMEDNLILGLLLSTLLIHIELLKWKILSPLTI